MPNTATTNYSLIKSSTPVIDGNALLHIIIASVAAGCGLAVAFGLILYGSELLQASKSAAEKAGGALLGLLAAAFCVFAVGVGVYVMTHPPKSKPMKVVPKSQSSQVSTNHRVA